MPSVGIGQKSGLERESKEPGDDMGAFWMAVCWLFNIYIDHLKKASSKGEKIASGSYGICRVVKMTEDCEEFQGG